MLAAAPTGFLAAPATIPAGAVLGAAAGGAAGVMAGRAVSSTMMAMARASKGRGANTKENAEANDAAKEAGLNRQGQGKLHDEISRRGLSGDEVREEAMRLAEQAKYLKNPPKPPQ